MSSALFLAIALREIRVLPSATDGTWRVTYQFSQPVTRIEFQRNGPFRRTAWRAETAGYSLAREGDSEIIRLAEGARARKAVTVAFPVDFSHPEKDDQLFERYSDGSMLLYTGHFNVAGQKSHRFVLTPRRGEHLIAGGRVFRRRTKWTDEEGEGTFVYFGKLVPVETPNMIAVIDPAVPKWLQQRLGDAVPRLFADYTKLTGWSADLRSAVGRPPVGRPVSHHGRRTEHPPTADRRSALQYRPTVFFSFEAARDPSSTTWKGGTLPGIIQLHIETAAGAGEDRPLLERFFKFLAHEAAHMWNGQLFKSAEQGQSWMHEGGADAFAWRALRRARASWPTTQPPRGARPGSR